MRVHRSRRIHRPKEIPKIAQTITQKSKKIFLDTTMEKRGKRNKQKISFPNHEVTQKIPNNEDSLILKISEIAKHKFL